MANLDVSDVLCDPDIADSFTVIRRAQVINNHGRATLVPQTLKNKIGVITAASGNDLMRLPEEQRTGRNLTVVTKFRLHATVQGFAPDLILWQGDYYIVKEVDPYPQYGQGFVQAIVGSIDYQDQPITEPQ